ncbi:MAG: hypothetical protein WCR54_02915 [Clostridia bacterium]
MYIYKATGNNTLLKEELSVIEEGNLVKVKTTAYMPSQLDIEYFEGSEKVNYPHSLGTIAIGVVSDDREEYGLKRGTKVIINPYVSEINDKAALPNNVKINGVELEGLFSDLVYIEPERLTPFPEDVKEDQAIFTSKIAIALSVLNSFKCEKGDYVAILGGSALCNIIAQLAMYFQMIPIIIDSFESNLVIMKDSGIYYTINSTLEVPVDKVKEFTGGRMAEHTIIDIASYETGSYLFQLSRMGGDCTVICENKYSKKLEVDLDFVSRRQLKVSGISNGASEFDSAINILAQKIINFNGLVEKKIGKEDAEEYLKKIQQNNVHIPTSIIEML